MQSSLSAASFDHDPHLLLPRKLADSPEQSLYLIRQIMNMLARQG
jgi:hypothetical protein